EDGSISTGLITDYFEKDAEVEGFIQSIQADFDAELQNVVAKTNVDLTILDVETGERRVRYGETNMANLCVDAYRMITGADVAITNGGGVRDNIAEGDITYEDILKVHPFGNAICVVEVTGQDILDALEFGARLYPAENGDFLHVSGMTYEIDASVPSSAAITEDGKFSGVAGAYRVQNVMVGDEPLDINNVYTLASHDYFLKKGGGGFTMLQNCTMLQDSIMLDNQILIQYITEYLNGEIGRQYANPYGEGRITIK
ncbi:MAG: 5'-nucleotidase C-terminal domain-containing protein, partial [Peptococcaceae bacterium]|nr:5'-nucleotidase C-terminal domain-containing protein [Peptococcaceae bacterium]